MSQRVIGENEGLCGSRGAKEEPGGQKCWPKTAEQKWKGEAFTSLAGWAARWTELQQLSEKENSGVEKFRRGGKG